MNHENKELHYASRGEYTSVKAAINVNMCANDSNCNGIWDQDCDGRGKA